jgi:hypothetical protein
MKGIIKTLINWIKATDHGDLKVQKQKLFVSSCVRSPSAKSQEFQFKLKPLIQIVPVASLIQFVLVALKLLMKWI